MRQSRTRTIPALAIGIALGAGLALPSAASARDGYYDRDYGARGDDMGGYGRDRPPRGSWYRDHDEHRGERYGRGYGRDMSDRDMDEDDKAGGARGRRGALDRLLIEHAQVEQAVQEVRPLLQEVRTALQQNDTTKAGQALTRVEGILYPSDTGDGRKQVERSLDELEQALRRNDREAADQALRRARESIQSTASAQGGSDRGSSGQAGAAPSSPSGSASSPGTASGGATSGSTSAPSGAPRP